MKTSNIIIIAVVSSLIAASILFLFGALVISNNDDRDQDGVSEEIVLDGSAEVFVDDVSILAETAPYELAFSQGDSAAETKAFNSNPELLEQIGTEIPFQDSRNNWRFCRVINTDFDRENQFVVDYYDDDQYVCSDVVDEIKIETVFDNFLNIPSECFSARYIKYEPAGSKYFVVPETEDLNTWAGARYAINGTEFFYEPYVNQLYFDQSENLFEFEFTSYWHTTNFQAALETSAPALTTNPPLQRSPNDRCGEYKSYQEQ